MQKKGKESQSMGRRMADLRKKKGITSTQLADIIGVTQGQISNYENDKQVPSAVILQAISKSLVTTTEYLLSGENSSEIRNFLDQFDQLNDKNRDRVKDYVQTLIESQTFKKLGDIKLNELLKSK